MNIETQIKIKNNHYLYRYLRDNSSWYKALNRDPNSIKQMEIEMKNAYKLNLRKTYPCSFKHKILAYDKKTLKFIKEYQNVQECSEDLKVARSNIYNCCNGKQKSCKGYILKYN